MPRKFMMLRRPLAACLFAVFSSVATAEDVSLNFASVPVSQFAHVVYRNMLNRDVVMSPEVLAMDRPLSVSVKTISTDDLPRFIDKVLTAQGVRSELRNGIYFLDTTDCPGGGCAGAAGGGGLVSVSPPGSSAHGGPALFPGAGGNVGVFGDGVAPVDDTDFERDVYRPRSRRAEFLATVVNAAFRVKPVSVVSDVLVISAPASTVEKVRKLLEQVDQAPSKVRVSATFVEVSSSGADNLGLSLVADVLGVQLGIRLGEVGSGALSIKSRNFQAVIDALSSDGRFRQVAAPSAIVDSNEKGSLSFGDSVPTIGSTTLDRNGNPLQQVTYQQSGVLLNVAPIVGASGRINVVIDGQVSSFSPTTTGVSGSPTLSKRQVQTSVTVDDGEVILIGGLNSNKTSDSRSGLSFLPKSWGVKSSSSANTDLVLVLAATVIK